MSEFELPQNNFQDAYLSFEPNKKGTEEPVFGILELIARQFVLNPTYDVITRITIALDISGSMQDKCKDGRTKIEHMRFTLIRLLQYFLEKKINVSIALFGFDEIIESKIETQVLEQDKLGGLIASIESCHPRNGTNIGIALQKGFEIIQMNKNADHNEVQPAAQTEDIFILMTDGEATTGITDKSRLKTLANKITDLGWTTFLALGCGYSHDSVLLNYICNKNYFFVYEIERVGETIAKVVDENFHKLLKKVHISVNNGEIFNWRSAKWESSCACDDIIADGTRTFHIRSYTPEACTALVSGTSVQLNFKGKPFEMVVNKINYDQNLSRFQYRQRTLELLAEIQHHQENVNFNIYENSSIKKNLKLMLKTLLIDMKKYMDTNGLRDATLNEESAFMNKLCDDVFIAYTTLGTSRGYQYVSSRQRSQGENSTFSQVPADEEMFSTLPSFPTTLGRQCTFAITQMEQDESYPPMPIMGRQCSVAIRQMEQDENVFLKRHKPVFSLSGLEEKEDGEEGQEDKEDDLAETQQDVNEEEKEKEDPKLNPKLLLGISCTESDKEEGKNEDKKDDDDFISHYKVTNSNPHANNRTTSLMREMTSNFNTVPPKSVSPQYVPQQSVPRCGTIVHFC